MSRKLRCETYLIHTGKATRVAANFASHGKHTGSAAGAWFYRKHIVNDIIIALIKDITFKTVTAEQPLVSTGLLDSVAMVDLVLALESEFSLSLDIEDLTPEKLETVDQIAALVAEKQAG